VPASRSTTTTRRAATRSPGLTRIAHIFTGHGVNANAHPARLVHYDRTSRKLRVYTALSNQANNHSDQSAISVDVLVAGA